MRCLALAQVVRDGGGQAIFVMAARVPNLESRLQAEGMQVVYLEIEAGGLQDARETSALAQSYACQWIVVDGYHFQGEYQRTIKDTGLSLLFVDDCSHAEHYYADIVLNPNIYACEQFYRERESYTKLLLGTSYALLRREFCQRPICRNNIPSAAKKILVTLGGADPDNVTLKVIQALQEVEVAGLEAIVLVGANNPHSQQLKAAIEKSDVSVELIKNAMNVPELMAWADVAVTAGGTTVWELAFMGVPSLVIILAENQRLTAEALVKAEITINLGWHTSVTLEQIRNELTSLCFLFDRRSEMTQKARVLVDGKGAVRVMENLWSE
jgi:UDP-2,4-diacetamido-2,4,6-trideoxy-beta-L-altropyranose hydrolase